MEHDDLKSATDDFKYARNDVLFGFYLSDCLSDRNLNLHKYLLSVN